MVHILENSKSQKNLQSALSGSAGQPVQQLSQKGKTPEEMEPFLLSGEPDDLSYHFFEKQ